MKVVFYVFMFLFGTALGSFLCCQAWRLKLSNSKKKSGLGKRSVCMHCKKQLKWYDNIPIISWLLLRGKCRYCKNKIGASEIIAELLTGLLFLILAHLFITSYSGERIFSFGAITIGFSEIMQYVAFVVLLLLALVLVFLAIYDGKWGELPTVFLIIAGVLGFVYWIIFFCVPGFSSEILWHTVGALGVLAGLYEILYLVSKGRWVGDGDAILCIPLALALGNVWLAVFVLFIANALGCLYALPSAIKERKGKTNDGEKMRIYFGPFLVIAFFIVLLLKSQILSLIVF